MERKIIKKISKNTTSIKKIALFGGSFNPPHLGHQMMLMHIAYSYDFNEIWVNPVDKHYFAKDKYLINPSDRVNMAKLAFKKISDKIVIKTIDIKNNFSKSFDTLSFLSNKYPNYKFTLILGEDNYNSRKKWYKFEEIEKMAEIIYLGRNSVKSDLKLPFKFPDISSSEIRESVEENKLLLDRNVLEYIKKNKLYL